MLDKLLQPLSFDWDEANLEKNRVKHHASFNEAEEVFFQKPVFFFADSKHSHQEMRYAALGKTKQSRLLVINFTIREQQIRVISARPQNVKERSIYEQQE